MRVFLDANILFSAAKSAGSIRELLHRLAAAGHVLCADRYVEAEARRNLQAKAASAVDDLEALLERIELSAYQAIELPPDVASLVPGKDQPVLAAAIRLRCDVLVTGDRTPFGALFSETVAGVVVHSPRSLFDALLR
jgi:predicted nucleic acid-binding protein